MLINKNSINVEVEPNEESITLLRLVASYISSFLNFNIDEIDEFKIALTEIINYFKPYWENNKLFKFSFTIENGALFTEINVQINNDKKVILDECSPELIIAKSLLDDLYMSEEIYGNCQVRMIKKKRE